MNRFWPQSLRWRLQVWIGFLLASVLAAVVALAISLATRSRFAEFDARLEARLTQLSQAMRASYRDDGPGDGRGRPGGPPPDDGQRGGGRGEGRRGDGRDEAGDPRGPARPRGPGGPPPDDFGAGGPGFGAGGRPALTIDDSVTSLFGEGSGFYFVVWFRDGSVVAQSANVPADAPSRPGPTDRDTLPHLSTRGDWREIVHCSGLGDCALVGRAQTTERAALAALRWQIIGVGLGVWLAGLGLSWRVTSAALRPVHEISAAAARIASGDLTERVRTNDPDSELGRLAAVLNTTFARLEAAFARQVQFTADAAHELRTPLAVLIAEAQTALSRERPASAYREAIAGALDTAQQMRALTDTLLTLARVDDDDAAERGEVDMRDVGLRVAAALASAAAIRGVTIEVDPGTATYRGRADRFELVVRNLVANAVAYNRPGGHVTVRAARSSREGATLTVSDTGVGIAAEHLSRIFDRFYRVDRVRARADGHVGLGLAICQAIVQAEGGAIRVESTPGVGSTFHVAMP